MANHPDVSLVPPAEDTVRVTTGIHDGEMMGGALQCNAVVFNDEASLAEMLAYAKGQTRMANAFLTVVLGEPALSEFAFALQGLLEPAMNALDLASKSHAKEAS